ncbi:MAG: hypothetical protein N2Z84_03440, partial [Atribacterota bacterium]|nr:hypothetical protein [Atribacterota bacterium]
CIAFIAFWFSLAFVSPRQASRLSRQKGFPFLRALGNAFQAFFHYPQFLWVIRLDFPLDDTEKQHLLCESSCLTQVTLPSSFLCPFCKVEIPDALKTLPQGAITVKTIPLLCPRCKTRFDVCRYCTFFEPHQGGLLRSHLESGKCTTIKKVQNVEDVCEPSVAKRLKEMGWFTLHTGIPVTDSFHRPENCRHFQFDEAKTTLDHIPCMGKTRYLLLRIEEAYSHSSSGSDSN